MGPLGDGMFETWIGERVGKETAVRFGRIRRAERDRGVVELKGLGGNRRSGFASGQVAEHQAEGRGERVLPARPRVDVEADGGECFLGQLAVMRPEKFE